MMKEIRCHLIFGVGFYLEIPRCLFHANTTKKIFCAVGQPFFLPLCDVTVEKAADSNCYTIVQLKIWN